jgi:hypothetical protein
VSEADRPNSTAFWRRALPLLCVLGAAAVIGSASLVYPMGREQGVCAYLADEALRGRVLYRDLVLDVSPLAVMVHVLALLLFGHSMHAVRILDLLLVMATSGFVYAFALRAFGRKWLAVTAGVLYPLLYGLLDYWSAAQADGFLNLPVAAAFWLVAGQSRDDGSPGQPARSRPAARFVAGFLMGLAVLFRPAAWLLVLGLGLAAAFGRNRWRQVAVWYGSGVAVTLAGFLAVLAAGGALPAFLGSGFPAPDGGTETGYSALAGRVLPTLTSPLLDPTLCLNAILGLAGLVVGAKLAREDPANRGSFFLVLVWAAGALGSVFLQGNYLPYQYSSLLAPLAVLNALALSGILIPFWRRWRRRYQRALLAGAAGLLLFGTSVLPQRFSDLVRLATGSMRTTDYWCSRRFNSAYFALAENLAASEYLSRETRPTDRVFIWGNEPLAGFLASRANGSSFVCNRVLRPDWPRGALSRKFLSGLSGSPPEAMLVKHGDVADWPGRRGIDSYEALKQSKEMLGFVLAGYELSARIGRFDLLRRASAGQGLPDVGADPAALEADLHEALAYAALARGRGYATVLWPLDTAGRRSGGFDLAKAAGGPVLPYRDLNRSLWLERDISTSLPALSIWIRGDNRAFAQLQPFTFQSDGEHFVSDDYRFGLLRTCANGLVLVYEVAARTGEETVSGQEE